jgi:hypothetical protein
MNYNSRLAPHIGTRPVSPGFVTGSVLPSAPVTSVVTAAPALVTSTVAPVVSPLITATQVVTEAPPIGGSRFEYVPYQKKVLDYEVREYSEVVPRQRTVTELQERRYTETVPRTVVDQAYYAIEHRRQYIPQVIPEAIVETIPVERIVQRTEYIPIEKTIVHYPQQQVVQPAVATTVVDEVITTTPGIATTAYGTTGYGYGNPYGAGYGLGSTYGVGVPAVSTVGAVGLPAVSTIGVAPAGVGYGGVGYGGSPYGTGYPAGYGAGYGAGYAPVI